MGPVGCGELMGLARALGLSVVLLPEWPSWQMRHPLNWHLVRYDIGRMKKKPFPVMERERWKGEKFGSGEIQRARALRSSTMDFPALGFCLFL